MNFSSLGRFVGQDLRRNRRNFVFAVVGIVVGISSFVFFIGLGSGIQRVVSTEIFPLEANRIRVVPRMMQFDDAASGRVIDAAALGEFSRIPGVAAVYPRMKLAVPSTMAMVGSRIDPEEIERISRMPGVRPEWLVAVRDFNSWLEIMADGLDPRLVENDAVFGEFRDPDPGRPVPILLSKRLVELYNSGFARTRNLPPVNDILIPYLPALPLTVNDSFVSDAQVRGDKVPLQVRLVGTSHHALLGGISMPLETVRKLNRALRGERAADAYDMAVLEAESSARLTSIQEAVRALGFGIDTGQQRMAESVGFVVTLVTLGFTLISLVIVALAAVNIAHTFFMIISERRREIGLLRAVGATRRDIRVVFLGEAALVGGLGGAAGVALGTAACLAVDWLAVRLLPEFPFKPDRFFGYPWWMPVGGILIAVLFCVAGAFPPSRRASGLDPASTLTGR
ncbi:MAG: ABC transporter permease [Candidatus Aminicenantes bacterium]|nr:ABC transporter permease [Candidatus Aminicenantes bacterium]